MVAPFFRFEHMTIAPSTIETAVARQNFWSDTFLEGR